MISVTLIAAFLYVSSAWRLMSEECGTARKCRCKKLNDNGDIEVGCTNVSSNDLVDLPFSNITSISLRKSSLGNLSVLRNLGLHGQVQRSVNMSLHDTQIDRLSWEWMPDNLHKLSLANTGTVNIFSKRIRTKNGSYEYKCKMEHIKRFSYLFLMRQETMKSIPSCIPNQLKVLALSDTDLSKLGNEEEEDRSVINWPKALRWIQFSNNGITKLSDRVFLKSPPSLISLTIRNQPINDSAILLKLPASTLQNLRIQITQIKTIPEFHFTSFRETNILILLTISYSALEAIPEGMPSSIETLDLDNNKIKSISMTSLSHMQNLTSLSLNRNMLQKVTLGLPQSLEYIGFLHNKITSCNNEAFKKMRNLTNLYLAYNKLTSIPKNIPQSILYFDLQGNKISDIGSRTNYAFCSMCVFKLAENPLVCNTNMIQFLIWMSTANKKQTPDAICSSELPGLNDFLLGNIMKKMTFFNEHGCFYNVTMINCTVNTITELIDIGKNVKKIYLSYTRELKDKLDNKFIHQTALLVLHLTNMGLTRLPKGLPRSILHLNLSENNITALTSKDAKILHNLTNIISIDFSNNRLVTMPLNYIQPLTTLKFVILDRNPLNCNCELWPFTTWLNDTKYSKLKGVRQMHQYAVCEAPSSKKGVDITELTGYYEYDAACIPDECYWDHKTPIINCSNASQKTITKKHIANIKSIVGIQYWAIIDLSGLRLKDQTIQLKHLSNLTTVHMADNSLSSFPIHGLPKTVVNLNLKNNNIESLPALEVVKKHLPDLRCIDLRNNRIKTLNEKDVRLFPYLKKLLLHGNPLVCKCELSPLVAWISANKNNPKVMKNHELQKLLCHAPHNLAEKRVANLSDQEFCPKVNVSAITGGLVGGVIFLIILAILCNIIIHRQCKIREREAILQGFRELLQQEATFDGIDPETGVADAGRFKYDAFVSYSPHEEDSEFAMMLLDELEVGHHYKLCAHERDFVPGMGIADNIVECIGASKRIILILSHNFVSSPWCQYEVQIALTELHQKRKSKLLIPILLEDLSSNVQGSVKTFLSLIKSIQIPSNNSHSSWELFWNEIKEAMPDEAMGDGMV